MLPIATLIGVGVGVGVEIGEGVGVTEVVGAAELVPPPPHALSIATTAIVAPYTFESGFMLPPSGFYMRPVGAAGAEGFVGLCFLPLLAAFACRDMAANRAFAAACFSARFSSFNVGVAGSDRVTSAVVASAAWACVLKALVSATNKMTGTVDFFIMGFKNLIAEIELLSAAL